ncbi:Ldh family oxidoreductase [Halobellus rubicundus]|uniref:Ldh family oxidoreductase n=1 Tax=Halobellus rubicundus TaxID=2996466 RepID=A0ABD5MA92_9EURY
MSEPKADSPVHVDSESLRSFVETVLTEGGVADEHAHRVADGLVRADMRGVSSHGVARLEVYMKKFEGGGFNPDPDISVTPIDAAAAMVDADDGPGQSAAYLAMNEAMDLAREAGIGMASVTNSNHFGTAAYYTEYASDEDFIGIAMTNVGSDVIPFGGSKPFLGTNPISVSVPTNRSFPITLDMATSIVAMGRIQEESRREDTEIPSDWAVNEQGEPTTDPHEAVAVRPVGGPKGYGLGVVVDVLCGLLSGVGTSPEIGPLYDDYDQPMRLGHFIAAIDVSAFRDVETFKADVDDYIDQLKAVETREGFDEVKLPGEIETAKYREQAQNGVELQPSTVESLRTLAEYYDVSFPN